MSLDITDLVDAALDEQARRNAAFKDQPGINDLITDFQGIAGETVGAQADTITPTVVGHPPHKWDDGQTMWDFFTWDT